MKRTVADSFGNGRKKKGFEDFPTKCLVRAIYRYFNPHSVQSKALSKQGTERSETEGPDDVRNRLSTNEYAYGVAASVSPQSEVQSTLVPVANSELMGSGCAPQGCLGHAKGGVYTQSAIPGSLSSVD